MQKHTGQKEYSILLDYLSKPRSIWVTGASLFLDTAQRKSGRAETIIELRNGVRSKTKMLNGGEKNAGDSYNLLTSSSNG